MPAMFEAELFFELEDHAAHAKEDLKKTKKNIWTRHYSSRRRTHTAPQAPPHRPTLPTAELEIPRWRHLQGRPARGLEPLDGSPGACAGRRDERHEGIATSAGSERLVT